MAYETSDITNIVKETLDARIYMSYDFNDSTMKLFKREAVTEPITGRGRDFTIRVNSNESYGSIAEGGQFPAAVDGVYKKATVNYRRQFASFDFTGDVEDLRSNKTLRDAITEVVDDTTAAFDEKQNFFLFGSGTGAIATQSGARSGETLPYATSVTNSPGARFARAGQLCSIMDSSNSFADLGDCAVSSVARSTDVVTFAGSAVSSMSPAPASGDLLTFRDSYNQAPQGFAYHVNNGDTDWLGLNRTTFTSLGSIVHDAASASLDWDMCDIALLKSRNARGDNAPKFDYTLIMHPVQYKNLRAQIRSTGGVSFNANVGGNSKIDLGVQETAVNGMTPHEDSWCPPSDVWGLKLGDWANEEVVPRQLYKHHDGSIFIQKIAASTAYGDAKEGRVYCRYNIVCKQPHRQFRIKNVNFEPTEVVIQRG